MRQRINNPLSFATISGLPVNTQDSLVLSAQWASQRSAGSTVIDVVHPLDPLPNQHWQLVSMSISAGLILNLAGYEQWFGKFGKILAGVSLDQEPDRTFAGGLPYKTPTLPIFSDVSLTSTLWDPDTNPLPPLFQNPSTTPLLVETTISPPLPLDLVPGGEVAVGVWMQPMLLGSGDPNAPTAMQLFIVNGQYTIIYDDGR